MLTENTIAAHPDIPDDRDILVCIFQRGAADGLNALVPYFDSDYYAHRTSIAVPAPDPLDPLNLNNGIPLTNYFDTVPNGYALHPALQLMEQVYLDGNLALVHATGVPHQIRSHFSAQNLIERGVIEKTGPSTGWLGRHLAFSSPATGSAFRAISISGNVPVALGGAIEPLAIDNLNDFGFDQGILDSGYPQVLTDLFRNPIPFSGPAEAALAAMDELQAANIPPVNQPSDAGYPNTVLGGKLLQAAQLIKSNIPVEVVCIDSDGWDHHQNLPTYIGPSLTELAGALRAFYDDMGPTTGMQRITVLVYTEFGRRIKQNGSQGTDHGTASLAYLMGGGVNGGQVISDWPGLDIGQNEDLQITTDLRTVITEMLDKRLGGTDVGIVFPGFTVPTYVNAFI
ncbi:MAG: DUF1501 domain-containing protein [Gammaproteobacteria bacterium]|nr:DUF1501 domain-containing protein [Gammaproteobacteria bacterium]